MNEWINDSDLPKLQSIELGKYALNGDSRDDRQTIDVFPGLCKNTLTMKGGIE